MPGNRFLLTALRTSARSGPLRCPEHQKASPAVSSEDGDLGPTTQRSVKITAR